MNIPVVIMAGGRGTRLMPYTDILPKPLISIGGVSMVEHVMNRFYRYGCRRFYMLVNYKNDIIKRYFTKKKFDCSLEIVVEEHALGTGGGLSLLRETVCETFVLINCDTLLEGDFNRMYQQHRSARNLITMVCAQKSVHVPYGVVVMDEGGTLKSMQEKPDLCFFVNTGCYFVEPQVIRELEYNRPIDFTDVIERYMGQGERIGVYPVCEKDWIDMGQTDGLEQMRKRVEPYKEGPS